MTTLTRTKATHHLIIAAMLMAACLLLCCPARAQSPTVRTLASFFGIGGYFFTSGSAARALGSPKFYTDASFFVRPVRYGDLELSGGVHIISASDHFLPFTGGNFVDWYGAAFRLSTRRHMNRARGIFIGGFYLGRVRSERLGLMWPASRPVSTSERSTPSLATLPFQPVAGSVRMFMASISMASASP